MNEDQELLDRFAIAAMQIVGDAHLAGHYQFCTKDDMADVCWEVAIAMKQARDRICTTAKPAEDQIPPFPPIEEGAIPERPAVIAAKRLGFEDPGYSERS